MAATVGWYDNDETTVLSSLDLGILQPGEDYITKNSGARHIKAKNTGDTAFTSVEVEIQQVASYDAWTKVEIATGAAPTYPGDYSDKDDAALDLGALAVGAFASVWIQVTEPAGASVQQGKLFNLALTGAV